ncbi:MAG TPA: AMP-binding protein [Burkholderiaceae bacterium]|nr:AMP-binding protein [Burkholderiaceae bacterium]
MTADAMPTSGAPADGLLPFVSHRSLEAPVGWRDGRLLTVRQLIGEARALAARLPESGAMLNACGDRFNFAVGLLAALLRDQQSVLPNNLVAHTVADLRGRFASLYQLTDGAERRVDGLPEVRIGEQGQTAATGEEPEAGATIPAFPADRIAACLFTSGSTGRPVAHPRSWGAIVRSAQAEAAALAMDGTVCWTLLGTVPPQHSYGFESTVHLALQAGSLLAAEHPFYPADVLDLLARLPAPRLLVTTPVHLRALLAEVAASTAAPMAASGRPAVRIERLMAATAPLPPELARQAEQAFGAELVEIYGSTESGQVALRRPTLDETWQTLPGVRIESRDGHPHARDGHVGEPTPLGDVLELVDDRHFLLRGRTADMVNIAGKRSSIAFLDRQLLSIDGVVDGAFYLPDADDANDEADGRAARLTAFVVAPTLTAATLTEALRDRIEPVFLPRPLHFVDALPRDGNGKLPRQRLQALARALSADR